MKTRRQWSLLLLLWGASLLSVWAQTPDYRGGVLYLCEGAYQRHPGTMLYVAPDGTILAKHTGSADQFPALPLFYRGPASPYPLQIMEYLPGPGQYVNDVAWGLGDPKLDTYDKKLKHLTDDFADDGKASIALGNFGGRLVFRFDHPVQNTAGDDLFIEGNGSSRSCEPAIVWVAQDRNLNGLPDEGEWYELKGAQGTDPAWVTRHYEVTYYKPQDEAVKQKYIKWKASDGREGFVAKNQWHKQSYWPSWLADKESYTLQGTRLDERMYTEWKKHHSSQGYVDGEDNSFDISDAIDYDGNPVTLSHVDFVMVQSAVLYDAGVLGEVSSEVCEIKDLHHQAAAVPSTFRKVSYSTALEGFKVKVNGGLVRNGEMVPDGTTLQVELPEGYIMKTLTANGEDIMATAKYTVKDKDVVIACTFAVDPSKLFAVTFAAPKAEEGTLLVSTSEGDLKSGDKVLANTELTVKAEAKEGYKLATLTANGEDILATGKYTMKDKDVEIACTFAVDLSKLFAVTFAAPKAEEGTLLVSTSEGDLKSGDKVLANTELTVKAEAKEGYKLATLTANGEDILATGKYTVKDKDVEIACTFMAPATPVESALLAGLSAYPNPVTTTLTVEGLGAAHTLALLSATGQVVRQQRLQGEAALRLDLSSLPSGLYLLVVSAPDGERTLRVVRQ